MKTKAFLLVFLFMGIGLTRLSAQKVEHFTGDWPSYLQPVYCNGVHIDDLYGTVTYDGVQKIDNNGNIIWQEFHNRGTVHSTKTKEVFVVEEKDKQYPVTTFVIWRFNLVGDQGTHYLGSMTQNWTTNDITIDKFVCVENGPKK